MQNWKSHQIKGIIFDLFDYSRILFNDYCNGFNKSYDSEDFKKIEKTLRAIKLDIGEIEEWIENE